MKTKAILWSGISVLVLGLAAGGYWWWSRPQVIVFSDDATLTLVKVDYGRRHTPPAVGAGARGEQRGSSFNTPNDALVLWVHEQYDRQQYHYFQFFLSDKAGTGCAQAGPRNWRNTGNEIVAIPFDAFPRRHGKLYVRAQEQGNGQETADRKFVISNPARKSFASWTAESLPSTKEDGDLAVTLTALVAGADTSYQRDQDNPDDPANKGVQAVFQVARNGKPVSNWQPISVETSDATGNHVNGGISQNTWQDNNDTVTYQYGLWPDEPAWKVRFEFSEQSNFPDDEKWTVQNIPLQPGRQQDFYNWYNGSPRQAPRAFAETDLNGVHLKIYPAIQFSDVPPNSQPQGGLTIQATPALPNGMRMTLISLTDDQTNDVGQWDSGTMQNNNVTSYRYGLRDITGVTNLNLTLALHKSRFVEFTVKAQKPQLAPD